MLRQPMIQIPRYLLPNFRSILEFSIDDIKNAVVVINKIGPVSDIEDLVRKSQELNSGSVDNSETIIALTEISIGLCALRRDLQKPPMEVLERVGQVLEFSNAKDWDNEKWLERISVIEPLVIEDCPIDIMSKARSLLFSVSNILNSSQVVTDVRYIYDSHVKKQVGAVIMHTMIFSYQSEGDFSQIHLSVSLDDIEDLISKLNRAKEKGAVTNNILESSGIQDLTPRKMSVD